MGRDEPVHQTFLGLPEAVYKKDGNTYFPIKDKALKRTFATVCTNG